jgi:methyl-accepting chemotaxis protein
MKEFGRHVSHAGDKLSNAVFDAVESTKGLAEQNLKSSDRMEKLREQLLQDTAQFKDIADLINDMISTAGNTFEGLKSSQTDYLEVLRNNVSELSDHMTELLSDYAEQANAQTGDHLKIWSDNSTQYAQEMNSAVLTLSGVVEEIQQVVDKVQIKLEGK